MHRWLLVAFAGLFAVSGCIQSGTSPQDTGCGQAESCANPSPDMEPGPVVHFPVTSHDGVVLDGYVHLPVLAAGEKVPVVLHSTPYPGTCASNALKCFPSGDDPATTTRIDTTKLVRHGFAVAHMNVRGTGNSGGCFAAGDKAEQLDQLALIDALASAPWSNGKVAMIGHSYPSFTAWQAAVQSPPALKTIVVSGHMTDLYTFYHTTQGALHVQASSFQTGYVTSLGLPPLGGTPPAVLRDPTGVRVCSDQVAVTALPFETAGSGRDEAFWSERRLSASMSNVTAAVFIVSGFEDSGGSFHSTQDDTLWNALAAPKRGIWGHWGHELPPPPTQLKGAPFGSDWYGDVLLPWLDVWLKDVGTPHDLGTAWYQDTKGNWSDSTAWPPTQARYESLYLGDGVLAGSPSAHVTDVPTGDWVLNTCNGFFVSSPVQTPTTIAGNPMAYLQLESDQSGGVVGLDLVDLGPDVTCASAASDTEFPWTAITSGAADLQFYNGNLQPQQFPTGTTTPVRVDFYNQAWTLQPGHRLGLNIDNGPSAYVAGTWTPNLRLHGDGTLGSHLVLPIVEGTLGGLPTGFDYPARPFPAT